MLALVCVCVHARMQILLPGASKVSVYYAAAGSYINFACPLLSLCQLKCDAERHCRKCFFLYILMCAVAVAAAAVAANRLGGFALKRDVMLMCHSRSAADPSHRRSNKCCSLKVMPATNQAATTGAAGF